LPHRDDQHENGTDSERADFERDLENEENIECPDPVSIE
jgi:hypothetical protein